ncbi:MAG: hypothetical protein JWM27_4247 [Gemmatimonadetes bacterium]|nr:hypothetical protein [Gemmatimonadota bacterium]
MARIRLHPEDLEVTTFSASLGNVQQSAGGFAAVTDPVTDPDTWEDTCIKMCPSDDTCTMLGCTRALAY